jgi:L-aspartate oxidase
MSDGAAAMRSAASSPRPAGEAGGGAAERIEVDVCVVGAGAAGLYASLCAAREGAWVALLSAMPLAQTASYWAQGGLAAALAADDSPELHLADTETAGRGAVRRSAAEALVAEAPACVRDLQELGFHFDADRHGRLALGLEGGHSIRRIVHAGGSATGRRLLRELSALVVAHERVRVIEGARMSALLLTEQGGRCLGVDCAAGGGRPEQRSVALRAHARATILSTGGAAALWARTTNPPGSIGQGLLLAHAAGAELADLEFVQFHPTAVIGVPGREGFLITEAIRGEGAVLLDAGGERFVDELAPRDEVSRAIQRRLQLTGARSVSLDMRAIDPALFPNVVGALREAGLDPTREPIPVAPAAHYTIGGAVTDLRGRTAVAGLYAVGETACTGLHGANRLASNSLSECFVFGRRAALAALDEPPTDPSALAGAIEAGATTADHEAAAGTATSGDAAGAGATAIEPVARATREALSARAGIERDAVGLSGLLEDPHPLARMLARSALAREETRGTHARSDHPEPDPTLDGRHAVLSGASERLSWQSWR